MIQPLFLNHFNLALKRILEVDQQTAGKEWAGMRPGFDQQIQIAILARFATRERTKHADTSDSVPFRDGQDSITPSGSQFVERHNSTLVDPGIKRRKPWTSETPEI